MAERGTARRPRKRPAIDLGRGRVWSRTRITPPGRDGGERIAAAGGGGGRAARLAVVISAFALVGCLRKSKATADAGDPYAWMHADRTIAVEPITEKSASFWLEGAPFCFAGTNNYYLTYKPQPMVDDVLEQAAAMGLRVIRTWAYIDRGSLDGTVPSIDGDGTKDGIYFQYWDTKTSAPAYNDGEDGLKRLDYVLSKARSLKLKILMTLTNNWKEFGGMDQYVAWYGLDAHHDFYTDERARGAYKAWVKHLVERVNAIDGTPYRDDPAIFAWELANEPRCKNTGPYDSRTGWDETTITAWATEMAAYVKSIDPNHMVAVGDEGFLNGGRKHWAYQASNGVDHAALLAIPDVDFGTFHLYPDHWGAGYRWGYQWIEDHLRIARDLGKPTVLEEYGIVVRRAKSGKVLWGDERRREAYDLWNETLLLRGGGGSMFWMLAGADTTHGKYPDYDKFTVYNPDPFAKQLSEWAARFGREARACTQPIGEKGPSPGPFVEATPPAKGASAMGWINEGSRG